MQTVIISISGSLDIRVTGKTIIGWTDVTSPYEREWKTLRAALMEKDEKRLLLLQEIDYTPQGGDFDEYTGQVIEATDEVMLKEIPLFESGKAFLKKAGVDVCREW